MVYPDKNAALSRPETSGLQEGISRPLRIKHNSAGSNYGNKILLNYEI
jgi:hypothetical protein